MSTLEADLAKQAKDLSEEINNLKADNAAQVNKFQQSADLLAAEVAAEKAGFEYEIDALRESLNQARADSAATRSRAAKMEVQHATHDLAAKLVFDTEFTVQAHQLVGRYSF